MPYWRKKNTTEVREDAHLSHERSNAAYAAVMEHLAAGAKTRVRFRLELRVLQGKHAFMNPSAITWQIGRIFNMRRDHISLMESKGGAIIICSPLQFVGFLIWRHDNGFANVFQALQPQFVARDDDPASLPTIRAPE